MRSLRETGVKVKQKVYYLRKNVWHKFGLYEDFYRNARGSRILIYHGVCERDHTRFNPIFLTRKRFENHLKYYKKYFNIISLEDYYAGKFSDQKFNICLTFDDGFANNYKYVLPLLQQYQMPATFFITAIREAGYDILWNDFLGIISKYGTKEITYTGEVYVKGPHDKYISTATGISLVEQLRSQGFAEKAEMMKARYPFVPFRKDTSLDDYWLQMTTEQITHLAASPLVTIGAHGYYHNDLVRISINDAAQELSSSKRFLENIINKPVNAVAFPYGTYTPEVVAKAKEAGYRQLLAMDFLTEEDHADISMRERFTVNPFISTANQMYATIKKCYEH